ncbi:MAG: MgtC/SapB family protein [Nanoarchaeota archaeon]|nr:MgtC/SapB family protein [Nanoarchaeota archaeon]MBU1622724.1 MgtC/SapB family protein [Nanoarchaeota archaeon]MBU1974088.1 MgtC/SapB family protein [Nanoarchaeota archaeon]
MAEITLFINFMIALALGALIGLEREYASYKKRGHDYAGIRTFPLIAIFGTLSAYLGQLISIWLFVISMLLTGILIIVAYFVMNKIDRKHIGATSELAGFITFFIGALCFYGDYTLAVVLAIAITIILFARSILHHFAERIKPVELASTLKFAVVAFVILPFLPNQGYGPMEMFNPYIIWLMVVFISGIGFFGYILMKWFGEKGITLAGILGGLISSTATTTGFAERSKKAPKIYLALALGVILANSIMFIRILIEVFVLNRELFLPLLLPLGILFLISAIFSYILWKKVVKEVPGKMDLGSPFTIKPALKFGIFFAVILALVKIGHFYFQTKGVYLVSFISGFADVDAITVSLANLSKDSLSLAVAKQGIVLAALTNVAVKGGIAYWFGGKQFGRIIAIFYAVLIVVGIPLVFLL